MMDVRSIVISGEVVRRLEKNEVRIYLVKGGVMSLTMELGH
jgi:hypothetical protein